MAQRIARAAWGAVVAATLALSCVGCAPGADEGDRHDPVALEAAELAREQEQGEDGARSIEPAPDKDPDPSPAVDADDPEELEEAVQVARSALDAASPDARPNLFNEVTGIARPLEEDEIPQVMQVVEAFRDAECEVGFVVYNLDTQRGIGYNADAEFFSASTVKAPFVAYVVQEQVEGGVASLDDEVRETLVEEGTGVMASDGKKRYSLREVLFNTIVHSDNTGYALLRERFDGERFEAWCAAAGVDAADWDDVSYPYNTPRNLAKLWLSVGRYLASDASCSSWLEELFEQTDTSFLRRALGDDATVLSKPGFELGVEGRTAGAMNDAGVVLSDHGAYVVAIMSDADFDSECFRDNEHLIVDLACALDDVNATWLGLSQEELASRAEDGEGGKASAA